MKYHLLLLEDIINHGRKGDFVHVAAGFARNYLLPQKKAILATKSTVQMREKLQKERSEQALKDRAQSERVVAAIQGQMFETVVKVDPDGHMYGSVTAADISEILARAGQTVDKKHIVLPNPIRVIGNYQVSLRLPEGVEASIGLVVKPDREVKKPQKKKEKEEGEAAPEAAEEEKTEE